MTGNLISEPARRGEGWTDDDHERLVEAIRGGLDLGEVADRLQRSRGGATIGATIGIMGVVKKSVSLEAGVAERVETAAQEDGMSFSTWLSAAAERQLVLREGLRAVSDWEREAGRLSDEELAAGEVLLDRLLSEASRTRAEAS